MVDRIVDKSADSEVKEVKNGKEPMSADYARGTVGQSDKQTTWTCRFCGMANTGDCCNGCGSPRSEFGHR